jgi:O-antigen/teichoic acid export membrane protein
LPAESPEPRGRRLLSAALGGGLTGPALIYIGATALNSAIPFVLLPFLTRWLGAAEFGIVGVYVALVNVLGVLVGLSTHGLISVVYYREGPDAMPPQVGAAIGVVAIMASATMAAVWIFRTFIARETGIDEAWLWTIVAAAAGQFVLFVTLAVFQTRQQPFRYGAMQISFAALLFVLSIVLIGEYGMGWRGRLLAQALTAGVVAAIGLAWLTRTGAISWNVRRWPVGAALAFGLPLIPHALGAVAMNSVDRFALGSSIGPAAVGRYYVAVQLATVLVVVATALNQAWLPWLYERLARNDDGARRAVVKATYAVFALIAAGGAGLALLAPWLVPLVAGPGYDEAIGILRLLGPASAFGAMYFFVAGYLFYEKRAGLLSAVTLTVALVQIALTFWLVQVGGTQGVATATLLSMALYFAAAWGAAHHVHPMPWLAALTGRRPVAPGAG